ncbi:Ark- serine/threonine protein kinase [Entomophthora muscae]|uniref:Ark- serine/threonine protein kinase n=1 Tax=Entomophthora muscae TaxID=34485 RepID=A0ACC2U5N2_9FUNG|nr:Ark- serine/threonine protein kinase [Entomophthora muscae]
MDGFLDRFNFSYPKDSSPKDRADPQFRRGSQDDSDEDVNDYIPYHDVSNMNQTNTTLEENDQTPGNLNDINNVGTLRAGEEVEVGGASVVIEKFLAEGGNAHVYIAAVMPSSLENTQANPGLPPNRCVLKRIAVPDKASLLPIDKEIETMKKLQGNPNIVEFYASSTRPLSKALSKGQRGYEAFILMEYCTEGTLVEFMKLREASMFSEPEVLYFFHEICLGVAAMHSQTPKIVHRDLKVENVLITNTQKLKLCDFGSSTTELIAPGAAISVAQAQVLEDELAACTTLQYRAPEMLDLFQRRGLTEKLGNLKISI